MTVAKQPHAPTRRAFLKLSASVAGLALAPSVLAHGHNTHSLKPTQVGLQLYTLRDMMQVSVPATLKLAAAVGYKEMEFAGYFNHSAKEIKTILAGEGLTAPSAHVALQDLEQNLNRVLDDAQTIGHKYVVVPWLSEAQRGQGIAPYQRLADKLNSIGEACHKVGITLAYHNHDFEFEERDGQLPLNVLIENTHAHLVAMELDLYWTVKAKQDPVAYFKRYPGRFKLWHVKDMAEDGTFADVGKGIIDFKDIFTHGELAGIEHKFVERDQTNDSIATIKQGFSAVNQLNLAVHNS